ncbi:MAG: N-acetylmuramoyl-L-alanine amidase [Pseudomonadota bacterium]
MKQFVVILAVLLLWPVIEADAQENTADTDADETAPIVTEIDYGTDGDRLRLALKMRGEPVYDLFTLEEPNRLVLDFESLEWQADLTPLEDIDLIADLRYGLFRPGRMRVVMDLAQPVEVERIFIRGADEEIELVLDLTPTDPETFASRAGWPEDARWQGEEAVPVMPDQASSDLIVVIDPGHGGIDPGAIAGDLLEKDVVLEVALSLAERISREPGFTPVLTRSDDRFLPLRARLRIAREARAHIFLSLHADAITEGEADGMSIYTLSEESSDQAARAFAERENRSDVLAGADLEGDADDVTRLLIDLARRGTGRESDKLARSVLSAMRGNVDLIRTRPIRQAGFFVLKSPDLPSILIELGFLSSENDRKRFTSTDYAERVAEALVVGLHRWRAIADPAFTAQRTP